MIDLQQFCAKADDVRFYLQRPFKSEDGRIMASNGHIAVLLDPWADLPDVALGQKRICDKILEWAAGYLPEVGFIAARWEFAQDPECIHCDGKPAEPDEDGDVMECYWCDGTGFSKKEPIAVGDAHFAKHYLRMVASLPECEIVTRGSKSSAYFRFNGGVGFLMPTREP
jgi:hypothetical protein